MSDERPTQPPPSVAMVLEQGARTTWAPGTDWDTHLAQYVARWREALTREAGVGHFPQPRDDGA